jgi:hypothetical protein
MKVEGETAYEPDMLVLMERFEEVLGRDKKVWREATIVKDRSTVLDGKTIQNPKFSDFEPSVKGMLAGGKKALTQAEADSAALFIGPAVQHTYTRPGAYRVTLQAVISGRLSEYRAWVVVSTAFTSVAPIVALPRFSIQPSSQGLFNVTGNAQAPVSAFFTWRLLGGDFQDGTTAVFSGLRPGRRYTVLLAAERQLEAAFYARQCYAPANRIAVQGFRASTNREFDEQGTEINLANRNELCRHVFANGEMVAVDTWTLELPIDANPFLRTVDAHDRESANIPFEDVVLALEYEVEDISMAT